jgi:hypothetical protein
MVAAYEKDVVAWANEQAALLRARQFSALDIEHLAEEIEDVGKSEQRELASRMAVLLMHLLKWQYQSAFRCANWNAIIKTRREQIGWRLRKTPSLEFMLMDPEWIADMWADARDSATGETGIDFARLLEACPWTMAQVLDADFYPEASPAPVQ